VSSERDLIRAPIEQSSLGTPGAKQLRARTPARVVEAILDRMAAYEPHPATSLESQADVDLAAATSPDAVTVQRSDNAIAAATEKEFVARARKGDRTALRMLYLRHRDAARKVAGMCASSAADADDAVAEGFARAFAALPRIAGHTIAFRPYLLTCVRNAATDRLRRERQIRLRESLPETPGGLQADDMALLGLERNLVGEALQALPVRWRTVLLLTEVDGLSPAEVSARIGIKPKAVAALAYRARKGLREAYLQAHLRAEASVECRATVSRLGNYVQAELNDKDRLTVQAHLDTCAKCRRRRDELTEVNATLRDAAPDRLRHQIHPSESLPKTPADLQDHDIALLGVVVLNATDL
jgi:RNA polymerase sigma factor (sigma-70 family)